MPPANRLEKLAGNRTGINGQWRGLLQGLKTGNCGLPLRRDGKAAAYWIGALCHVTSRGDRREDIFGDDDDRLTCLATLAEVACRFNWLRHAYCLMRKRQWSELFVGTTRGLVACGGLTSLSVFYCLPGHPSAGGDTVLDILLHAGLFAGLGLGFGWFTGRGAWAVISLTVLAALLEVVQWWVGSYARIEGADILANETGVALASLVLWLWWRRRATQ